MTEQTDPELERRILVDLYEDRSENPTAFQRIRGGYEDVNDQKLERQFENLVARNILKGNIDERNLMLTIDGVKYVEENYPEARN